MHRTQRVLHKPTETRAIIDESNTFFRSQTNLDGCLDLVSRSRKPLQELAWSSIGNILTAIQIREARRRVSRAVREAPRDFPADDARHSLIYLGEEIGMTNADFESLGEIDDTMTVGKVEELLAEGVIDSYDESRRLMNYRSRDHARTPMQWTDGDAAGFTDAKPWLKLNENYTEVNVAAGRTRIQSGTTTGA